MTNTNMTTQQVANRYCELMKQKKRIEIQERLYDKDIINKEPEHAAAMGMAIITKGLDAVKAKSKARGEMIETVHNEYCSEPLVAGNYFTVALERDMTMKGRPRVYLSEIAVFEVKEGKIVSEQFFY